MSEPWHRKHHQNAANKTVMANLFYRFFQHLTHSRSSRCDKAARLI